MNDENVLFPELDADIQHFGELYPDLDASMESEYYDLTKINPLAVTDTDFLYLVIVADLYMVILMNCLLF